MPVTRQPLHKGKNSGFGTVCIGVHEEGGCKKDFHMSTIIVGVEVKFFV